MSDDVLFPDLSVDEWMRILREVRRSGHTPFSGPKFDIMQEWQEGNCRLRVLCQTNVILYRSIAGARGRTLFAGMELRTGQLWGEVDGGREDIIGCFVDCVLRVEIRLDLSDWGESYEEQNDTVRQEREGAAPPKQVEFDSLPLEFSLIHEEMHAEEFCREIVDEARQAVRCSATDTAGLERALRQEWNRLVEEAGHGDPNSPGEENIRRQTWEEWDRRHP